MRRRMRAVPFLRKAVVSELYLRYCCRQTVRGRRRHTTRIQVRAVAEFAISMCVKPECGLGLLHLENVLWVMWRGRQRDGVWKRIAGAVTRLRAQVENNPGIREWYVLHPMAVGLTIVHHARGAGNDGRAPLRLKGVTRKGVARCGIAPTRLFSPPLWIA